MIWSCLQGHMGEVITDGRDPPLAAQIAVGDFCFFAGAPDAELAAKAAAPIMVPRSGEWAGVIGQVWSGRAAAAERYAIKREPGIFDCEKLRRYAAALPEGFSLRPVDARLYALARGESWSADLCSQFAGPADYAERGIGFAVLRDGRLAAGASSYTIYTGGIEIEIDTRPDFRRQGLASACGARLILECLGRGLYPGWDAHDLRSAALAEKLGYRRDAPYRVYIKTK